MKMGLITKEIEVKLSPNTIEYYDNLGYAIPKVLNKHNVLITPKSTIIKIKVDDLPDGSNAEVNLECDVCGKELKNIVWNVYLKSIKKNGIYCCRECATEKRIKNGQKTKLKNGKSFKQWCIDNNRQDILNRWDYELNNNIKPSEICFGTYKKYYFKCPKGIHKSELKGLQDFINGHNGSMNCNYCNSLGKVLEDKGLLHLWSNKNIKSPYEYSPFSHQHVYCKCPDGIHKDFKRSVNSSNKYNFRCPECQYSKGEEAISNYFINKEFIKISQEEFEKLIDENKYNVNYYIPQKEFDGLIGINNGLLSYDFYLPKYNLLIEYQGEQHEHYCKGFHKSKKDFEKQQEHDRRKREYCLNNNINLLEIWYYDFDNIEEILERELKI